MIYHSTRNEQLTASSTHAVLQGIAPDGGLYICDPAALRFDWRAALEKDTLSMAADILHALLPDFQDMDRLVRDSYAGKFPTSDLTPLTPVADKYVLELYHGPTSAFKDVALSVLPRLIVAAAKAEGMKGDVVILTATSGDTGKAAMEGFHDVPGTRITVFYPYGGVIRHAGDGAGQAGALAGLEHDDGHQDQRTQYLNHRDYQIHCFHRSFQSPVGRLLQSPSRHLDAD